MALFLKILFHIILSPKRGWEDTAHEDPDSHRLMKSGVYPVFFIAALSTFVIGFYDSSLAFVNLLQRAIITFMQFFISYFIAQCVFAIFLRRYVVDDSISEDRISVFISVGLGLLAIVEVVKNVLPVELSLVRFLPLYVIAILWKGASYLDVKVEQTGRFVILSVASIIVPVYLLGLLNMIL